MADEMSMRRRELTQRPLKDGYFLSVAIEYDQQKQGYFLYITRQMKVGNQITTPLTEASYKIAKLEHATRFSRERLGHLTAMITQHDEYKRLVSEFAPLEPHLL